jgi:thiol-disulfide isomerase/thioredoxin
MKRLLCIIMLAPFLGYTQIVQISQTGPSSGHNGDIVEANSGIQWAKGLSWEKVKEKAKAENKFIFLDCFATWCGPCKQMDKNVYVNDSVGNYFNHKFIAVKVQIDRTTKDDELVRGWYQDAQTIAKDCKIEAYPTLVFLSPAGGVVHQEIGYKNVADLIEMAQTAIQPGKVYNDPFAEYDRLVLDYKNGVMHYDSLLYMIKRAQQFDTALARQLIKSHTDYLLTLPTDERYTKEDIEFWNQFIISSKARTFNFFYNDGEQIDRVMNQKGYSTAVVDKTIFHEVIIPFMIEQNKNKSIAVTGMYVSGPGVKPDYSEANWKELAKRIRRQFKREYIHRNVMAARIEWYKRHHNDDALFKYRLLQFKKYPPFDPALKARSINEIGWRAFLQVRDKELLTEIIGYIQEEVSKNLDNYLILDTYANLLYKIGKKEEAIAWEQKAIGVSTRKIVIDAYTRTLEQMKRGEPTNGVKPL